MSNVIYNYIYIYTCNLFSVINPVFVTDCLSLENDDVLAINSKMINLAAS